MSKIINYKQISNYLLATALLTGGLMIQPATANQDLYCRSNNGQGNNDDIVLTLVTGTTINVTNFDPSNPGDGNYLDLAIDAADPNLTDAEFVDAKDQLQQLVNDVELHGLGSYSATCGSVIPKLWGIDEDDGQLFAMGDYTDSSTLIDYGLLKWNNNGTIEAITTDMEALTLDKYGNMYIALNRNLLDNSLEANLLKFNIANASQSEDNIVEVVGKIGITLDSSEDDISGLSIDPISGDLIASLKDSDSSDQNTIDKLFVISKTDASLVREIAAISGLGHESQEIEDIEHAPDGSFYITQNMDDHTYRVDLSNGAILEVIDNNQADGLGASVKFEALGWDFANNRLIGFDDDEESLANLTLQPGNNYKYYSTTSIGLTDVEGVDFVPTPDGTYINAAPGVLDYTLKTIAGKRVTMNAIADATDLNGDSLSIVSINNISGGTATHENGVISYVHNQIGTFTFTYTITDGTDTSTGNVTVDVLGYSD